MSSSSGARAPGTTAENWIYTNTLPLSLLSIEKIFFIGLERIKKKMSPDTYWALLIHAYTGQESLIIEIHTQTVNLKQHIHVSPDRWLRPGWTRQHRADCSAVCRSLQEWPTSWSPRAFSQSPPSAAGSWPAHWSLAVTESVLSVIWPRDHPRRGETEPSSC